MSVHGVKPSVDVGGVGPGPSGSDKGGEGPPTVVVGLTRGLDVPLPPGGQSLNPATSHPYPHAANGTRSTEGV